MKLIIENNTKSLTDKECLIEVVTQIDNFKSEFYTIGVNPIHKRQFQRLKEVNLIKFCYYVNRIKTGLTVKFYDE